MKVKHLKEDSRKTILALSWRDIHAPNAGGAEVHTHEMLKRVNSNEYRIIHLSAYYPDEEKIEMLDGILYLRCGNVLTVIWHAFLFYRRNHKKIDYVIEQCNTHRFFAPLWVPKQKRIFYIHQLTKEIWDYSAKFPLNKIGKALEESFLRLNKRDKVITVSESTKYELIERGYKEKNIVIIPNGISFEPWSEDKWLPKEKAPTFIYVGRFSPYKGIDIAINAFGKLHEEYPNAHLWILGKKDEVYMEQKLLPVLEKFGLSYGEPKDKCDVVLWGFVSEDRKRELLSRSWALLFPSIREGWGIPITEAGNVGTPSIVFDSPGIIDAVDKGNAGYVCQKNNAEELYQEMRVVINDNVLYNCLRHEAYSFSKQFQWDKTGIKINEFLKGVEVNEI